MRLKTVIGLIAVLAYVWCWFVNNDCRTAWYIGISLPWGSLIASLPMFFFLDMSRSQEYKIWGVVYYLLTLVYVISVSVLTGRMITQLPHLIACIMFVVYFLPGNRR